jgi:hypothetical protein
MTTQYGTTFRNRAFTFEEACKAHASVEKATVAFARGNADRTVIAKELWESLVNLVADEDKTVIGDVVDLTIPAQFVSFMRRSDSIIAVYAFGAIIEEILWHTEAQLQNDLQLRPAFTEAWRKFNLRRLEANNVEEGFGCDESMSWHTLRDIDNAPDAGEWKQRILEIAKLAGKMFDSFNYMTKKVKSEDPMEVDSVKVGKEVERLLPQELAMMTMEDTQDLQTMKVLKGEAQQRKMKGVRTKGRGPLVICIDESGSMHDAGSYGGRFVRGRNTWAKACAVALTRVAWSENREVRAVHFGSSTVTQDVPKDDTAALFEMARSFMSGGTDFTGAMRSGMSEVSDLASKGFKGADIVLLTDGEEHNHAAHNQMLDQLDTDGVDLWSVAIGQAFRDDAPMRKRAKKYVEASDSMLKSDSTATALVDGLQGAAMDNKE